MARGNMPRIVVNEVISTGLRYFEDRIAVIFRDMKQIHWLVSGRDQLFDLDQDPGETSSIADANPELIDEARKENVTEVAGMKKQDLIFKILKERVKMNGLMYGEGTREILPDGFGFLRSPDYHYL